MTRKIEPAMECYVKKGDKYLMLYRSPKKHIMPDVWMAPGGHIDKGEGIFSAAKREIMEETGLTINNLQIKANGIVHMQDIDEELVIYLLTADYVSGEVIPITEHDGEFVWLTKKEILALPNLLAELPALLEHVLAGDDSVVSYYAEYKQGNEMIKQEIEAA